MKVREFLEPFNILTEVEIRMDGSILFKGTISDIRPGYVNCPSIQAAYHNQILDLYLGKDGALIYGGGVLVVYATQKEEEK